jgi:SAM-dependent methyltransferase
VRETSKTLQQLTDDERSRLRGRGIDIGCGDDPVCADVERFDVENGDANDITRFVTDLESYDYVFSSHCLEHMKNPPITLAKWWSLVKPGGTMVVIVPDENLYEQGYWPSLFNPDHKATFRLGGTTSWSPVSHDFLALATQLPHSKVLSVRRQDEGYDQARRRHATWPRALARAAVRVRNAIVHRLPPLQPLVDAVYRLARLPEDQTQGMATAQNIMIVAKDVGPGRSPLPRTAQLRASEQPSPIPRL